MTVLELLIATTVILCFPLWQRRTERKRGNSPEWPFADLFALIMTLACALPILALAGSFVAAGVIGIFILLLLERADKIKRSVLREPVVLADFVLLRQIVAFPVFYFPFLTPRNLAILAVAAMAAAAMFLHFMPLSPLPPLVRAAFAALPLAALLLAGRYFPAPRIARLWARFFRRFPVSHDANRDVHRYGVVGCALLHGIWFFAFRLETSRNLAPRADGTAPLCRWRNLAPPLEDALPHVVVVQAESFMHLRKMFPGVGGDWTANFDRLAANGRVGRLATDTFGAYTVRTEFSVVSGVNRSMLVVDGINPYLPASRSDVGSLARVFSGRGYGTICLHPNSARFFARDRVIPHLGFARFIDGAEFETAPRYGPFVSDGAVGDRVAALLANADAPQFIFAITIEAHGPWRKRRLAGLPWPDGASPLSGRLTKGELDGRFAAYARHLRHTDALLGRLAETLSGLSRPAVLAFYGDHPGCLPPGTTLARRDTDFLVWRTDRSLAGIMPSMEAKTLPPHMLGDLILSAAGWRNRR